MFRHMADDQHNREKKKLLFLGQMCRLDTSYTTKKLFTHGLFNFVTNPRKALGLIPDLYRVFVIYELNHFRGNYLLTGVFPTNLQWKSIVNKSLSAIVES